MSEGNIAADALRLFIERIERLEEEKSGIAADIKDVYSEAKSTGYDTKIMRQIVALRKMDPHKRREAEALLETYKAALGMDGGMEDMFAGHDGSAASRRGTGEHRPVAADDAPSGEANGRSRAKSFRQEVSEKIVGAFAAHDDGVVDVEITSGDGVVAFESKAAKARKAKAGPLSPALSPSGERGTGAVH